MNPRTVDRIRIWVYLCTAALAAVLGVWLNAR
jgi:ribose/xylose/arabinose/galactoside ABC-type transport system permease subunit